MLHRNRKSVAPTPRGLLGVLALVIVLSSCRTAPDVAPTPESLPLPDDAAMYLFLSPREAGDPAHLLLDGMGIGPILASRIEIVGIALDRADGGNPDVGAEASGEEVLSLLGGRQFVAAARGDFPSPRRLGRILRRSDEWIQSTDALDREYYRQLEDELLVIVPEHDLVVAGTGAPEDLPRRPAVVPPWPRDFLERFASVSLAAYIPSPGGGAVSTPLGGVLPLQELRFYVDNAPGAAGPDSNGAVASDPEGRDPDGAADSDTGGQSGPAVNVFGEAVLDTERSARAFEAIMRLLALGVAVEMGMEPGRVRELLTVEQRGSMVAFTIGPLDTEQLTELSSQLLLGYGGSGGARGLFGATP